MMTPFELDAGSAEFGLGAPVSPAHPPSSGAPADESRNVNHERSFTFYVLRFTFHVSRFTFHVSRLSLAALLFCAWTLTRAGDVALAFEQANRLYEEEKFTEAAAAYQSMIGNGRVSSALYFNLGNALFKSGQIGRAIANYRLAEQLA